MKREEQTVPGVVEIDDVQFVNFPTFVEDGKLTGWPLVSGAVAEGVAEKIPERFKKAVTVDWSKLDTKKLMEEFRAELGIKSPFATEEESEAAERKLLDAIFGTEDK